jgi:hypothetical protein
MRDADAAVVEPKRSTSRTIVGGAAWIFFETAESRQLLALP